MDLVKIFLLSLLLMVVSACMLAGTLKLIWWLFQL